jgi:hypothetical protein
MNYGKFGLLELAATADVVAALLEAGAAVHDGCRAAMAAFDAGGVKRDASSRTGSIGGFPPFVQWRSQ